MAKVGFWLKGARGKFAGAVLQKGENGTISRENVTPANPRTRKQMIQRTVVKTVSAAGAQMKQLISESFEGLSPKEAVRQFQRENTTILRQNLAEDIANGHTGSNLTAFFLPKQVSKVIVPNAYKISEGSLVRNGYGPVIVATECDGIKVPTLSIKGACPYVAVETEDVMTAVKIKTGDFLKYFFGITNGNQQCNLVTVGVIDDDATPIYVDGDYRTAGVVNRQDFNVMRFVPSANIFDNADQDIQIDVEEINENWRFKWNTQTIMSCFSQTATSVEALNAMLRAINNCRPQIGATSITLDTSVAESLNILPVTGASTANPAQNEWMGHCNAAAIFISDKDGKVETASMTMAMPYDGDSNACNFGLDIETALASWEKSNLDFGGEGNFLEQGGEADTLPA